MSCQICSVPLARGDRHFGCILHRDCSRQAPCSFDMNEPPAYWDEVESLLEAAKCVSPLRKSSRVAAQAVQSKVLRFLTKLIQVLRLSASLIRTKEVVSQVVIKTR